MQNKDFPTLGFKVEGVDDRSTDDTERVVMYVNVTDISKWNKTMRALLQYGHAIGTFGCSITKAFMADEEGTLIKQWSIDIWGEVEDAIEGLEDSASSSNSPTVNSVAYGNPNVRNSTSKVSDYEETEIPLPFVNPIMSIPEGNNHDNPVPLRNLKGVKYGTVKRPTSAGG